MKKNPAGKTTASRIALLLALSCVWFQSLTGDSTEARRLAVQGERYQKPSDVPHRWKGLIGEYSQGRDTVCLLEREGALYLLTGSENLHSLREDGNDQFTIAAPWIGGDTVCSIQRNPDGSAASLSIRTSVYKHILFNGESGAPFRIKPLRSAEVLRTEALQASPPKEEGLFLTPDLVELIRLDSTIHLDIRYATSNNFIGEKFYSEARAFLQRPAAEALLRAHRALRLQGFDLIIHDAYRPWYVTKMFWDATPDNQRIFVADPAKGSRHNRGCAVDLSLYDLKTGREVEMVSGYDEFSHRAYPDYPGGTSLQRWHRQVLRTAMEAQGFKVFEWEWWHFDYKDWKHYPIGTVTFEDIR